MIMIPWLEYRNTNFANYMHHLLFFPRRGYPYCRIY